MLELPARVRAVTAGDVQRTARRYLRPEQRSIAWYLPGDGGRRIRAGGDGIRRRECGGEAAYRHGGTGLAPGRVARAATVRRAWTAGCRALLQPSDLSASVQVRIVTDRPARRARMPTIPSRGMPSFT